MHFEDFDVGDERWTGARTITGADLDGFARLSGDDSALHTDAAYARERGFERRVAHGVLVVAVITGLIADLALVDTTAIASLELRWRFVRPVLEGDAVRARLSTRELRPTRRADRGVLTRDITVFNDAGEVVQEGLQTLLLLRRHPLGAS
jgi:acyl dehydratase